MGRLGLLLLLLLLGGCAGGAAGPCRLSLVADLPASLEGNRLVVDAVVNGTPERFVVDTGAVRTIVAADTVAALRLPRSQTTQTSLVGVSGIVRQADAYAQVRVGGQAAGEQLAVADLHGLAGVIGADFLSDYDVEFDAPAGRIRLWEAPGCGAADVPWAGPRAEVRLRAQDGLLGLTVTVDGRAVAALLDSGARTSLVQASVARRLGVTAAVLATDPAGEGRGVDGGAIGLRLHRFTTLTVGPELIGGPEIAVAAFRMEVGDMLLGMDYFRTRRVWIAYRSSRMFVQPGGPG